METFKDTIIDGLLKVVATDSPLRKRLSDPALILEGAGVRTGLTAAEIGCGRGFFTIPLAEALGPEGQLYSLDVTQVAVDTVTRKLAQSGLSNAHVFRANALDTGLPDGLADLALLFGVVPSPTLPLGRLLPEMQRILKPDGRLAVWTAIPGWSPQSITRGGLFSYLGKTNHVYTFRRE